jgi:hypothetical protein
MTANISVVDLFFKFAQTEKIPQIYNIIFDYDPLNIWPLLFIKVDNKSVTTTQKSILDMLQCTDLCCCKYYKCKFSVKLPKLPNFLTLEYFQILIGYVTRHLQNLPSLKEWRDFLGEVSQKNWRFCAARTTFTISTIEDFSRRTRFEPKNEDQKKVKRKKDNIVKPICFVCNVPVNPKCCYTLDEIRDTYTRLIHGQEIEGGLIFATDVIELQFLYARWVIKQSWLSLFTILRIFYEIPQQLYFFQRCKHSLIFPYVGAWEVTFLLLHHLELTFKIRKMIDEKDENIELWLVELSRKISDFLQSFLLKNTDQDVYSCLDTKDFKEVKERLLTLMDQIDEFYNVKTSKKLFPLYVRGDSTAFLISSQVPEFSKYFLPGISNFNYVFEFL